jgi:hypothetical protein
LSQDFGRARLIYDQLLDPPFLVVLLPFSTIEQTTVLNAAVLTTKAKLGISSYILPATADIKL